jgi:uncharacterized membrane protein YbhN (UPF0104 family)
VLLAASTDVVLCPFEAAAAAAAVPLGLDDEPVTKFKRVEEGAAHVDSGTVAMVVFLLLLLSLRLLFLLELLVLLLFAQLELFSVMHKLGKTVRQGTWKALAAAVLETLIKKSNSPTCEHKHTHAKPERLETN